MPEITDLTTVATRSSPSLPTRITSWSSTRGDGKRNREIGIRVALGARPRQVTRMFLVTGVKLGALGVLLGLPLSVAALYAITSSAAQDAPTSRPLVGVAIAAIVMTVALLATWLPARRAAGVDPLIAIRAE